MVPIPQAPLWKALVVMGLRYGEAASLRWADLDEEAGAEIAKSKRSRMVPVPRIAPMVGRG